MCSTFIERHMRAVNQARRRHHEVGSFSSPNTVIIAVLSTCLIVTLANIFIQNRDFSIQKIIKSRQNINSNKSEKPPSPSKQTFILDAINRLTALVLSGVTRK